MSTVVSAPQLSSETSPDKWPRISIVTPCFNKVKFLEAAIQSVLDQGYPNLEYIIVDGGSTDGSTKIVQRYASDLTWWTSEPDNGMYDALQKGFSRTTGEIMRWVNADDIIPPKALFTVAELFHSYQDLEWVQGCPSWIDEAGRLVCTARDLRRWSKFDYYLGDYRWIQQESTYWRRSLWEKAGGYVDASLELAGDLELWARFFRHAPLHITGAIVGAGRWCREAEGQLSRTRMGEYEEEAAEILRRERNRLSKKDRRTLQRLRWVESLLDSPLKLRILNRVLNIEGIRRWMRRALVELPPGLEFNIDDQSFVKRRFFHLSKFG